MANVVQLEHAATLEADAACGDLDNLGLHIRLGHSPSDAASALRQLRAPGLGHRARIAEQKSRDVLVLRCHLLSVPRDRDSFLETLDEAYAGGASVQERAAALHSYHRRLLGHPDSFPSLNARAAARRQGFRQRRIAMPEDGVGDDAADPQGVGAENGDAERFLD